jgi:predicted transcriptional regulator of viral defense system
MWIEFQNKMSPFRVFSTKDVAKQFPGMNPMNLVRWQRKGYILKLRNGWYAFQDTESHENIEWLAANLIYAPSYISLQTALSWYNLIPEMITMTTSVTSRKTNQFITSLGRFDYHRIKPELYGFGYTLEDADPDQGRFKNGRKIMVASPQKAILDFFYINSFYDSEKEMEGLRLNENELAKALNEDFFRFLERYKNNALERRINLMIKTYGL